MKMRKQTCKWGRKSQVENRDGSLVLSVSMQGLNRNWGKTMRPLLCGSVDVVEVWCGKKAVLHIVRSPPPPPPEPPPPPVRLEVGEFKLK